MSRSVEAGRPILLPTAYFPPLAYYACLASGVDIIIEQTETFPKQTYRNRCEIMTSSGRSMLVVPVTKPNGNHSKTGDIRINYRQNWQRNHWRALQTAYNSSPFFIFYHEKLKPLFELRAISLIQYNHQVTSCLNEIVGISPRISYSRDYEKEPADKEDFRNTFTPKNLNNGIDYPVYSQVFRHSHGFIAGLSILDLLFNLGPDTKDYLENLKPPSF